MSKPQGKIQLTATQTELLLIKKAKFQEMAGVLSQMQGDFTNTLVRIAKELGVKDEDINRYELSPDAKELRRTS